VSFQGSLGTLDLPEVLRLLACTAKSGELRVSGNRTAGLAQVPAVQGGMWFDCGSLAVDGEAGETGLVDALVELLRLVEGTFTFRPGPAPDGRSSVDVADALAAAQARLAEWRAIEQVVPSHAAWLELNADVPNGHVGLRADEWRLVVAVGAGN